MSAQSDPRIRHLKIKTGVLKRVSKEKAMYEQDIGREEARLVKMTQENKDECDLKHQAKVIEESRMMVQETIIRLSKAYDELKTLFEEIVSSLPSPLPESLPQVSSDGIDGDQVTSVDGQAKDGGMEGEEMDQDLKDILAARDLLQSIHCDPPMDVA